MKRKKGESDENFNVFGEAEVEDYEGEEVDGGDADLYDDELDDEFADEDSDFDEDFEEEDGFDGDEEEFDDLVDKEE
jgi:hypothetical protein